MKVLIATDAWSPQVNGVVRTLQSLAKAARQFGATIDFLTPEGFASVPLPTYPGLRLALPSATEIARRIEQARPDAVHIATEGPIGIMARRYCLARGRRFTTSYTTRFPEYISARVPIPEAMTYAVLRRFHNASSVTMVSTASLMSELQARGFRSLRMWTRGVDTDVFSPAHAMPIDLPRPIFMSAGRVSVEKNLKAFLDLNLPGSKIVLGDGPQLEELRREYPDAHFLGWKTGRALAEHLAAADVFVFPSKTDTFGIVQLEALASGVPVAAFPVMGPRDIIADGKVGALSDDLRQACLSALSVSRADCRAFALQASWQSSARQFLSHAESISSCTSPRSLVPLIPRPRALP